MKKFINKMKYRWKIAPTWVKVVDITCWLGSATLVLILFI